jgi:hypothetical protein
MKRMRGFAQGDTMDIATRERATLQPILAVAIAFLAVAFAIPPLSAAATGNTCQARNVTKGGPNRSSLQVVIDQADPGDRITVRYVCTGHFTIAKRLTLVGKATATMPRAVLHANSAGPTLRVRAEVRLVNLRISGGVWDEGGGIRNTGTLTMGNTVVSGNRASGSGGGIANAGVLTMNGSSAVTGNQARISGGGVDNTGTLTMNGSSSVSGNIAVNLDGGSAGGIVNTGTLTLNDSSSVSGNIADTNHYFESLGGGIVNLPGGTVTLNDASSVTGNTVQEGTVGGIYNGGDLTLNGTSSVTGNNGWGLGGGIFNVANLVMNDASTVAGNEVSRLGGGIYSAGSLTMNGSSSVIGNAAGRFGGGIITDGSGTVTMNDAATVTGNTADAGDDGTGSGGGIFVRCGAAAIGAVDGGNVDKNYRGTASPVEDNIKLQVC